MNRGASRGQQAAILPVGGSAGPGSTWYAAPIEDVMAHVASDATHGVEAHEAARRLARDGRNELERGEHVSVLGLLGLAIIAIVLLNAAIGFVQEYRGDLVAADARLLKASALRANEAPLILLDVGKVLGRPRGGAPSPSTPGWAGAKP